MVESIRTELHTALEDYQRARRRAFLQDILGRLMGRSTELLSYEDVRPLVNMQGVTPRGLQEVPLDAIVGSVGRYEDFTRTFLPRATSDAQRWARVRVAVTEMAGLPPVELYKVGDAYFVLDGNHRVSVAREIGAKTISAYVTEVSARLPISTTDSPDELICKARYADFLSRTQLRQTRPEVDLQMTACGQYRLLEEEIEALRQRLSQTLPTPLTTPQAAAVWCDTVYTPIRDVIRQQGVLRDFPQRTEADLYVWLSEHQQELQEKLGWQIDADTAAQDLAARQGNRAHSVITRVGERLRDAAPAPGQWRRERLSVRRRQRLFADVLVPLPALPPASEPWPALSQALLIAQRESSMLHGLHVLPTAGETAAAAEIRQQFLRICQEARVPADFALETGDIARHISQRTRWIDLVVINMAYPPAAQPLARLASGFHALVQQTRRPILAVPRSGGVSPLKRALLAYNASPQADEALFLAAYLAQRWRISLAVVIVAADEPTLNQTAARASAYLQQRAISALFVPKTGAAAPAILQTAAEQQCDFIIMGGYSYAPPLELVLGSAVNKVLRRAPCPILICR